jgi:serine/threonine protein kinase
VWEGHDTVLTRPVTIKVLHTALAQDATFRAHFHQESVAAARLAHPNVVATFDTGEEAGTVYVVTELVRGRSLADSLAADGAKPPADAADIADQVAAALEHGHRAGLVHGAVAPGSIFLCDDGIGGTRVKVADFGIPPADTGGAPAEDVRALGAVLYEMLCDQPPNRDAGGDVVKPRKLRAGIPKPLETLTLKALATEPRNRFRSAFDFRRSLAALDLAPDDAEPLISHRPTPPNGVTPGPRRARRTWVPLIVFVVLAALSAALVTSIMGRGGGGGTGTTTDEGKSIEVAGVRSFDPEATPATENEDEARFAVDGNPSTVWHTERYKSAHFGNLKKGLGLIVRLSSEQRLSRLTVESTSRNWSAAVYVAPSEKSKLADWGKPVAEQRDINGKGIFNLGSTKGGAVLVWITDPGRTNQLEISELVLRG